MNWKMLNLAARQLNASALNKWKETFQSMDIWMQAVLVGVLVLLIGAGILSCWWGFRMNRGAMFAAGFSSVFFITLIILATEYSMEAGKAFFISAAAGAAGGFLYAFVERAFQFAAGFVYGTVLSSWIFPEFFYLKTSSGKGRIWTLIISIAAGILFALLAKRLKMVLTALEGGVVLGLLCDAFLPVTKTPWVSEKLTGGQIRNLIPVLIAASGVLIQLLQWLSQRAEQKALQVPSGDERDIHGTGDSEAEPSKGASAGSAGEEKSEEALSMAQAEEMLVEKAKELALAAERNAQKARLKERFEDVVQGLYSASVAAERLNMSEDAFSEAMNRAGYTIPSPEDEVQPETAEDTINAGQDAENTEQDASDKKS